MIREVYRLVYTAYPSGASMKTANAARNGRTNQTPRRSRRRIQADCTSRLRAGAFRGGAFRGGAGRPGALAAVLTGVLLPVVGPAGRARAGGPAPTGRAAWGRVPRFPPRGTRRSAP